MDTGDKFSPVIYNNYLQQSFIAEEMLRLMELDLQARGYVRINDCWVLLDNKEEE